MLNIRKVWYNERVSKNKKHKKKIPSLFFSTVGLVVFCVAVLAIIGIILFAEKKSAPSIYVFPENPKQGDTVFIRVKSDASEITGNVGQERFVFYKKANSNEWISFLGIDADQKPGDYKIFADTSNAEHLNKDIKVALADFSTAAVVAAPSAAKTGITIDKAVSNIRTNDNPALKKVLSNFTPTPYFTAPFSFPLSKMEKTGFSFGKFIGFAKDKIQHFGTDLRAPEKTDVYAVNNGKVVATLNLANYGKTVIIDHGLDIFSIYLHLNEFKVSAGDIVKRSQRIGLSGETGYATAPHLHFSMRVGDSRVDPIAFIASTQKINDNFILADLSRAFSNLVNNIK